LVALAAPWGNPFSGGGVEICHPTLTGRPPVPLKTKYDPNNFVSHESEHSTDCLELDIDAPQAADPAAAVIERSIESFARVPNGGLIVGPDTTNTVHRNHIVALAGRVSEVCDVGAIHEHFGAWKRRRPSATSPPMCSACMCVMKTALTASGGTPSAASAAGRRPVVG
jgi:hypothetical protein